jgi:inner membrane protein COX18
MEYMHDSLHLPYVWVIPIAALTIRALLYYPITLSTRQALQRRLAISPLISAHKPWYRNEAKMLVRKDTTKNMLLHNRALMQKLTKELQTRYNCGYLKTFFLPMLQLPVFLGMSWTLRDMIGMSGGGIKSFIYTMLGWEQAAAAEIAQQAVPAMMHEGLPWALDLTAADPTGMLSYGVAGIMLSQTLLGMRSVPGGSTMLSRTLIVFSLMIGPLMASAPAGILYYWACSSGFALVTNVYLDRRYPLVRFAPCKRPLLNNGLPVRARNTKQAAAKGPEQPNTDSAVVAPMT